MPIELLERFGPVGVVDIDVLLPPRLALVPHVRHLPHPLPPGLSHLGADSIAVDEKTRQHQVVVATERKGRLVVGPRRDRRRRVALVYDGHARGQDRGADDAGGKRVKDGALRRQVVHLQPGRGLQPVAQAVLAKDARQAGALRGRDLRQRHVAPLAAGGFNGVEGRQVLLGVLLAPAVGKGPRHDGLGLGDGAVHGEEAKVGGHVDRRAAVAVELVQRLKNLLELVAPPDVVVVVPHVWPARVDLELEAGDDAKVVARAPHGPEQIRVPVLADRDCGTVGKNHVELDDVVNDHAIKTFLTPVAAAQRRAQHADAVAGARGGDVAAVPEVVHDLADVGPTLHQGGFAIGFDGDVS